MPLTIRIEPTTSAEEDARERIARHMRENPQLPVIPAAADAHVPGNCYSCGAQLWVKAGQGPYAFCARCRLERLEQGQNGQPEPWDGVVRTV